MGSSIAFLYMDRFSEKIAIPEASVHSFLQNLNYYIIEEIQIGLKIILGRRDDFIKEQWNLLLDMIIKNLEDSRHGIL